MNSKQDATNGFSAADLGFTRDELIDVSSLMETGARKPAVTAENIELLGSLGELARSSFIEIAKAQAENHLRKAAELAARKSAQAEASLNATIENGPLAKTALHSRVGAAARAAAALKGSSMATATKAAAPQKPAAKPAPTELTSKPEYQAALANSALVEALLKHPLATRNAPKSAAPARTNSNSPNASDFLGAQPPVVNKTLAAPQAEGAPTPDDFEYAAIEDLQVEVKRTSMSAKRPSWASPILRPKS